MRGLNKVMLIGNVGQDPDVRYTPNGNPVVNLNLATDESYKDRQTGQMVPKTEWHRIVVFGKVAEFVGNYVKKGAKLFVEGKNQTRKWQKNGEDRYTTEVVVDIQGRVELLDSGPNNRDSSGGQGSHNSGTDYDGASQQHSQEGGYQQNAPSGYVPGSGYASALAGHGDPEEDDEKDGDIPF
jgi:single-strand DNA-binding protein